MEETGEAQVQISIPEKQNDRPKRKANMKRMFTIDDETSPERNNNSKSRPGLRRGSSFTFLTPGPQWDFSLKRKCREKDESDAVSLCSFDFKRFHYHTQSGGERNAHQVEGVEAGGGG
nr:neuroepithelial cell-transforming gene 1 protein-like [Oncorhynchus nerka]